CSMIRHARHASRPRKGGGADGGWWKEQHRAVTRRSRSASPVAAPQAARDTAVRKLDKHELHGHTPYCRAAEAVLTPSEAGGGGARAAAPAGSPGNDAGVVASDARRVLDGDRNRGFAFVQLATRDDAASAMAAMNEQKVHRRVVAIDWAVPRHEFVEHTAA